MKGCDQFREMFEAYALGALDDDERAALDAHLATPCNDCAKAVAEAHWLVSQLACLAPEAEPTQMLKARLMKIVRAEALATKTTAPSRAAIPFWMWAAVAAMFVVTLYSAFDVQRLQRRIREANEQMAAALQKHRELEAQREIADRKAAIVTDPASLKIALASKDPHMPQLEAMWHSQMGVVLTGQHVPVPTGNRVLQLWIIPKAPGSKPMPSLTMRPDADGKFVLLVSNPPELMERTKALAITEEPEGGSLQPTSAPMWVGRVG